ncbi:PD-(D/E)XK nuclease family protein [Lewinella sp. JB7]|uniref:PDDEXK-like family protein n=1 Tax=Lewinella sp. JB7 TaxID=2962887 RepID=UPI0020C9A25A|nr:PD-(D/E)XK nuclease family protein [Lewinella sp. JB7]MCP9236546.1 PD-(D/E)XK nuclease family protein [Lewinella sp. JB7]
MTTNLTFDRNSVNHLLSQVTRIKAANDRITKLKKENFNIFSLLRKDHDEVYLHSAFIKDLLNPRGTHEMGSVFASLFFEVIQIQFPVSDQTSVEAEKILPQCRADIYLQSGQRECIIENKIYAADQENQLGRNRDYLHARDPEGSVLIYLTLDGRESTDVSEAGAPTDQTPWYHQISYREHLLRWLLRCQEKAVDHPPLRETLKQYIFLVKKLTGKLTNDEMIEELNAAIRNNFVVADLVSKQIATVRVKAVADFFEDLSAALTEKLGNMWTMNVYGHGNADMASKKWTSLAMAHRAWPPEVKVEVQGQSTSVADQTVYGIIGNRNQISRNILEDRLAEVPFFKQNRSTNEWWVCKDNLFNFGNPEEMTKLFDPALRARLISNVVEKVVNLCNDSQQPLSSLSS